jgi:centromere/kinetochore protein ZW10
LEQGIETVIIHIRKMSETWKKVLSYSAWASAVGSLVNTVAKKIISDVFDRDDLGADEANIIAELIVKVTALDDLFIPDSQSVQNSSGKNGTGNGDDVEMDLGTAPLTARFADKWLKMQYLGEVLQSNLANIRFLWFESSLSLEFTKQEVVDLILLSFENNPHVRGLIKDIKESEVKEMDEQW